MDAKALTLWKTNRVEQIRQAYFARELTCNQCFHELRHALGSFYLASKEFQGMWMAR